MCVEGYNRFTVVAADDGLNMTLRQQAFAVLHLFLRRLRVSVWVLELDGEYVLVAVRQHPNYRDIRLPSSASLKAAIHSLAIGLHVLYETRNRGQVPSRDW